MLVKQGRYKIHSIITILTVFFTLTKLYFKNNTKTDFFVRPNYKIAWNNRNLIRFALLPNYQNNSTMKTLTVPGDPHSVTAIMVPRNEEFHDHEVVQITSSIDNQTVEKKIFRVVDGGEDQWELQFE